MAGSHPGRAGLMLRAYLWTRARERGVVTFIDGLLTGIWLGVMDRELQDQLDVFYYANFEHYKDSAYNLSGLLDWEVAALEAHFQECSSIVVTGAGAGREVIGLLERGFDAMGYEPNEQLVELGARLLSERGHEGRLHVSGRDLFPPEARGGDGVIVGWGSYTLMPRRERRVAFLRDARRKVDEGAPLLVSFFAREGRPRSYGLTAKVATCLRRLRRREPVEVGDYLRPNFVHFFSRDEITEELSAAGFDLVAYADEPYPHAVARAGGTARASGRPALL